MKQGFRYLYAGDSGLVVEFGNQINPELNSQVHRLLSALDQKPIQGVIDLIPTYRSLYIQYDPLRISPVKLVKQLKKQELNLSPAGPPSSRSRIVKVPAIYGGEYGPDLAAVAEYHHLTEKEVIAIHSGAVYTVYMIGFLPGFAYLGGMPEQLATPRLKTPRVKVPAGSVGIAGAQTGIYPVDSPGGWQIIGRTNLRLFNLKNDPPSRLRPGDRVRFEPQIRPEKRMENQESKVKTTD